jgi:hypothetical protein
MASSLAELFPLLYGACFLVLLWQAFRVMARGFRAVPGLGDRQGPATGSPPETSSTDRTGRLTIHPELLDGDGQLTQEDLLTVRFGNDTSSDSGEPAVPPDLG